MTCYSGFGRSVHLTIIIIIIIIVIIIIIIIISSSSSSSSSSITTVATDTIFAIIINARIRRMYSTCENFP